MTKDNLITIAMLALLTVALIFAARAALNNNPARDAKAAPNHIANGAPAGSNQPASTPVSSGQIDSNDSHIWTTEEMRKAEPYPMPMLPGSGPTGVSGDDTAEGPQARAKGGTPTKP